MDTLDDWYAEYRKTDPEPAAGKEAATSIDTWKKRWGVVKDIAKDSASNAESLARGAAAVIPGQFGDIEALGRKGINAVGRAVQKTGMAGEKLKDLVSEEPALRTTEDWLKKYKDNRVTDPTPQAEGMENLGAAMNVTGLPAAKATKGVPVGLSIESAGPATMAEVLKPEQYTLKTLERLPQNKGMIPVQTLREQLKRPDVSKPERDILEPLAMQDGAVKPEDILSHFKKSTENYTLTPHHHGEYADYGMGEIGRDFLNKKDIPSLEQLMRYGNGGRGASREEAEARLAELSKGETTKPRTTTWQLPEGVSGSTANHFQDPKYFGHTRAFEEGGIPHVVEVQSDLMQRNYKPIDSAERTRLEEAKSKAERIGAVIEEHQRKGYSATVDDYKDMVDGLRRVDIDLPKHLGEDLLDKVPGLKNIVDNHPEKAFQWVYDRVQQADERLTQAFDRSIYNLQNYTSAAGDEARIKLSEGGPAKDLTPMKKTHQQRLIKEELAMAGRNGQDSVRFATPDTVAKVEQWPEPRTATEGRLAKRRAEVPELEKHIASLEKVIRDEDYTGPEDFHQTNNSLRIANNDLRRTKDLIQNDEEILKNLGPGRFKKEHQGIYDNYQELEKYLKSIGGTLHTDHLGHTWIEVRTKGDKSPVKDGRTPMFSMAGAPLATGAASQYNAPTTEDRAK